MNKITILCIVLQFSVCNCVETKKNEVTWIKKEASEKCISTYKAYNNTYKDEFRAIIKSPEEHLSEKSLLEKMFVQPLFSIKWYCATKCNNTDKYSSGQRINIKKLDHMPNKKDESPVKLQCYCQDGRIIRSITLPDLYNHWSTGCADVDEVTTVPTTTTFGGPIYEKSNNL